MASEIAKKINAGDGWIRNLNVESLAALQLQMESRSYIRPLESEEKVLYLLNAPRVVREKAASGAIAFKQKPLKKMGRAVEARKLVVGVRTTDSIKPTTDLQITAIALKELHLIVCTKNKKYSSEKRKWNAAGHGVEIMIVSNIGAAMAARFGVATTAIMSAVVTLLMLLAKFGKEVFCAVAKEVIARQQSGG